MPCGPRRASRYRARRRRSIGPRRTQCPSRRRRCRTRPHPPQTLRTCRRRCPRTRGASRLPRRRRHRSPRPEVSRRQCCPRHCRILPSRPRPSPHRTRVQTRPSSIAGAGGAMDPYMICVRRAVVRRGMAASSAARGWLRRASSFRAVGRGASCRGPMAPPQMPASLPLKSDYQRHHECEAFGSLLSPSNFLLLCYRFFFGFPLSPVLCIEPFAWRKVSPPLNTIYPPFYIFS